ncbi:MAG TPA: rubredoxin [bacterium]|nr:rubredoxin [bacterium]HOL47196.1 rubredoxin [bacterium]HPQ17688.1 rubredoxin [bacterium]
MDLKTLMKISYGLYIISSKKDDKYNGQIANVASQVTATPAQIAICLNKKNLTTEYIQHSKIFSISILTKEAPLKFIGTFGFKSGRNIDKFQNTNFKIGKTSVPIVLDYTLGYIEAEVVDSVDVGSHILFIGKIIDAQIIDDTKEPMTYDYYHLVKGGFSPETAPTYIQKVKKENTKDNSKYKCIVCGYIYDPQKGDEENGIKAGTSFAELPASWVCPVCGVDKSNFEKL